MMFAIRLSGRGMRNIRHGAAALLSSSGHARGRRTLCTEPPTATTTSTTTTTAAPKDYKYSVSPLVSPQWLSGELLKGDIPIRVLDCSWHRPTDGRHPYEEFCEAHVPGARFFDIEECRDKDSPYSRMAPTAAEFGRYVGRLGIGNDAHVVVYENNEKDGVFAAPRVWWMFRLFGHRLVSVLNGGLPRWRSHSLPTATGPGQAEPADFRAELNRSLIMSYEDIEKNVEENLFPLVDSRSAKSYNRKVFDPSHFSGSPPGHIINAVSLPAQALVDPDTKTLKDAQELCKVFRQHNVDLWAPFISSCGSGVTACVVALCAHICGAPDIPVYDGSFSEWSKRAQPEHIVIEGDHEDRES